MRGTRKTASATRLAALRLLASGNVQRRVASVVHAAFLKAEPISHLFLGHSIPLRPAKQLLDLAPRTAFFQDAQCFVARCLGYRVRHRVQPYVSKFALMLATTDVTQPCPVNSSVRSAAVFMFPVRPQNV